MKNKIFELYKPDSLASFLEFSKTNPKEKFVYVIQQPPPNICLLYTSPSPRDGLLSRMPSSA